MFASQHPLPVTLVLVLLLAVTVHFAFATHVLADTEDNGGIDPPSPPGSGGTTTEGSESALVDTLVKTVPWLLRLGMI